jgi:oxygen-independent coproporphyrinogen-3 oxidase
MNDVTEAICKEANLQRSYISKPVETIYFGGGTPSLLSEEALQSILNAIHSNFKVTSDAEITLESNPDDITESSLASWKQIGINRLSIGVQSFFEEDLQWMNRAHNAQQAVNCIELAQAAGFYNITIDLIYGTPGLTDENWKRNIDRAVLLNIPHLSCYALTVEEGTALHHKIKTGTVSNTNNEHQSKHFEILTEKLINAGYVHYEISNFAKPGFESKHNSNYWKSKTYLGLGPSAHSYNGISRQWNIANNALYVQSLKNNSVPAEIEILTNDQMLNETIMISLRTATGISLQEIEKRFSPSASDSLEKRAEKFIQQKLIEKKDQRLILTKEGKFLADGIAADLFV